MRWKRLATILVLHVALVSCGSRPGPETLQNFTEQGFSPKRTVDVYAVTTRVRVEGKANLYDAEKAVDANYARYTLSVPPAHVPSQIEWPAKKPDPEKQFVVTGAGILSRDQFLGSIKSRDVGIFVHGYNNSFQEAVYRMAQISADSKSREPGILFAWPSQGALAGYVADKEAATYSRGYLADLIKEVSKGRSDGSVHIFAHSMGGWLTVEALRQIALEGRRDVLDKLRVVLAAPDIDTDVFRSQLAVIGKMKYPMTIFVSQDDRALKVSRIISASTNRVGAIDVHNPEVIAAAKEYGVQIVDISGLKSLDATNHNRYADVAQLLPALERQNKGNGLAQAGAFVFDTAATTVSSPFRIVSGVLGGQ